MRRCTGQQPHLDVLFVELHVVLLEALRLHPRALLGVQIVVVVVSSLHPVFHPLTAIITWTFEMHFIKAVKQLKVLINGHMILN